VGQNHDDTPMSAAVIGHNGDMTDDGSPDNSGLWLVGLGAVLAVLAPLAGFLGGTIAGPGAEVFDVDALLAWLIGGLLVGGVGVLVALFGGLRWYQANRGRVAL
jgi:hypothetical protein